MRKVEKKIHRKKKKEYFRKNDTRKEFKPYITTCRDSTGLILNEPSEIMEQWRQIFRTY
jgi:hypothetical protein